jgi:putative transposase
VSGSKHAHAYGRALDNVFVEWRWRTVKYEEMYVKDYRTPRRRDKGLERYFQLYHRQRPHQVLGYQTPAVAYFGSNV